MVGIREGVRVHQVWNSTPVLETYPPFLGNSRIFYHKDASKHRGAQGDVQLATPYYEDGDKPPNIRVQLTRVNLEFS